jgi:NhaP-type Na+/H+ or K+/H+ antiporter
MYQDLALLGLFVFAYSLVAGRLGRTVISGPILFTAFGLTVGPLGLDLLGFHAQWHDLKLLAELTLALVLFSDAAKTNLTALHSNIGIPRRLLLLGLPLTIALGIAVGLGLFPQLGFLEVALLATMLAPTDAALGKAVVTDERVPAGVREGLNVESGLNDGICVPILLVFLTLATTAAEAADPLLLTVRLMTEEIGIGLGVGVGVTLIGGSLIWAAERRGWVTESWRQLTVAALAVSCFALAQVLGGSGFIAAFTGGLMFGWLCGPIKRPLLLAADGTGDTMALFTWVIFGASVITLGIGDLSWQVVVYALLSLTLIRMLPVFLSLYGLGLSARTMLFLGWFGPRGLASIVFIVIVLNESADNPLLTHGGTLAMTVVTTVVLSILAHGLSANPLVRRFGKGLTEEHALSKVR